MEVRGILLSVCLAVGAFAAPLPSSQQCDLQCIAPSGFKQGRTYIYSYETETATFLQQETYGYSNLTVSCQVRIEAIGTCEVVLEVRDVSVQETDRDGNTIPSPNQDSFASQLTGNRLRFGMQAGKVTSVCASTSSEHVWATNFKRGILTALQLTRLKPSMIPGEETVSETTVIGTCPTHVSAPDESTLTKTKDFLKCEGRYNMHGQVPGIQLVPYAPSTKAITSEQVCRQEHNGNFMTLSVCEEQHILIPISDPPTGPVTTVQQTLTFRKVSKVPSNHALEAIEERSTIRFDHGKHMMEPKTDPTEANQIVSKICDSLQGGVDTDTAKLFPALLHEMRRLESTTLANVLAEATCEDYQSTLHQMLADALGECQSSGCVEIMVNLIQDNTVTNEETIKSWIVSLNFVNHPTKEMVFHLMQLAEIESVRKSLYLAVSSVINKYCTINPDCESDLEIAEAMDYFEDLLGSRCKYKNKEDKRKMMIAMRAIGNTGLPRRSLQKCYESESADISLRVAAMQATEQMPCDSQQQEGLVEIMKKGNQDSELRISAYKALMACPSQELLDIIDDLLEDETKNQVGGYIVSHLKNLQESQDPLKAAQRAVLQDHPITAKFLEDPMKFSQNTEWSWYNETSGYGLAGEGDVIFSSNSFIPRQVSVKGGFDAFGYAFEAFEFGGRMEGLQNLIESVLRPGAGEDEVARKRRSLIKETKLDNIIEEFELTRDMETDGNIYLKMFGREVMFMDAEDIKAMFAPKDPKEYLVELSLLALGKTYEVSSSRMLVEKKMSIPLINGLEMNVAVNVSTTERVMATGKLDILGMIVEPRNMEIDGTIEPSAATDISCLVEVDAHCARIGSRYELSTHTATSLSGKITLDDSNNLKLKLRAPEKRQELISVSSTVRFLHQEEFHPIPSSALPLQQDTVCTGEYLENAVGFRLCGESQFHKEDGMAPMSGTYEFSMTAEKVEADLTSFDFEVSYSLSPDQTTDQFHLLVGTPGTEVDRSHGLDWTFDRTSREFTADITSPRHHSRIVASRRIETEHQEMNIRWIMEDESEYSAYYTIAKTMNGDTYYPSLIILGVKTPQFGTLETAVSAINTDSQLNLDISIQGESRKFVTMSGVTTKVSGSKKSRYDSEVTIGGEYMTGSMSSVIQLRGEVTTFDVTFTKDMQLLGGQRSVTISGRHNSRGTADINQDFFLTCDFSHSPEMNLRLDGEFEATGLDSSSSFKFCYGQTTCSGSQKIILSHEMLIYEKVNENMGNDFTLTLQHPAQDTHLVLTQRLRGIPGGLEFVMGITDEGAWQPQLLIESRVAMFHEFVGENNNNIESGTYEVSLRNDNFIKRLNHTWERKTTGERTQKIMVQWSESEDVTVVVDYAKQDNPKQGDFRRDLDAKLTYADELIGRLHVDVKMKESLDAMSGVWSDARSVVFTVHDEDDTAVMFIQVSGSTDGRTGGSGSLVVQTPFNVLPDFDVTVLINRRGLAGFDVTLSLTLSPEEVYSLYIEEEKDMSETMRYGRGLVTITLPLQSCTLTGFSINDMEAHQRQGGIGLTVFTEDSRHDYGIGASFHNQSTETTKAFLIRINSTAPVHENSVELSLEGNGVDCQGKLDVEYSTGRHFVTGVAFGKKENGTGFTLNFDLKAPNQGAEFVFDHTREEGRLFNPHLTLKNTSDDVETTLMDFNLSVTVDEMALGKNSLVELHLSGPGGKTLVATTGIDRKIKGLHYHLKLANQEEVRLTINLDTSVQVENKFVTDIVLNAWSIYTPDWPVKCGLHLEKGQEDVMLLVFFKPLFIFNVTKSVSDPSPNSHVEDITIRVQAPTSVQPALHDFGMHILKENQLTVPGNVPINDGSVSFFWGPAMNQQLTISSASSVQVTEDGAIVEGSLVVAQPLRIPHLLPEYALDYSVHLEGPQLVLSASYDHGGEVPSTFKINHTMEENGDNAGYFTEVAVVLQQGKSFIVESHITQAGRTHVIGHFGFRMDDGDHHEEATLHLEVNNMSEDNSSYVNRSVEIIFEHSPSGLAVSTIMGILNNEVRSYIGIEGQCVIPVLDPIHFGLAADLDKETMETMLHAQGPVNDINIRTSIHEEHSASGDLRYRLETHNEINGVYKPVIFRVNYVLRDMDLIFETDEAEYIFNLRYINDSSIQASLSEGKSQNAQSTLTVIDPHTLYSLTTWDTEWPATFKEAAIEWIRGMQERKNVTLERYREIGKAFLHGFTTYMGRAMMRNVELIMKMREIGMGLEIRIEEMRNNSILQRETFKAKFANFSEELLQNLEPLKQEYIEMITLGNDQLLSALERNDSGFEDYAKTAQQYLFAYLMNITSYPEYGQLVHLATKLQHYLDLDREIIARNWLARCIKLKAWAIGELYWMNQTRANAVGQLGDRWEDFVDSMNGIYDKEEMEKWELEFQMSPAYRDMANLAFTSNEVRKNIIAKINASRDEWLAREELLKQDLSALRQMNDHFAFVQSAPLFGTKDVDMSFALIRESFFDDYAASFAEKMEELKQWAIEQQQGYKHLASIEDGIIEVWFYTDERYDDLISAPQQDAFGQLKVLGARLAEDFPLIDDLRRFKSGLYENSEAEMTYFEAVAEPAYAWLGETSVELEDLWEWNGLINSALYEMLGSQWPKGEAALVGDQHYWTFDGTYYAFSGKCSFLLAQDFADNNFTVAVEYSRDEADTTKSFVVIADGVTLEIRDGGVYIGSDQLEFPHAASESLSVTRDFSSIHVTSTNGFEVIYNLHRDILTIKLSLLYFGKTAGLFGNFNYEPADDFTKSNGEVAKSEVFTRSWAIGRQCTSHLNKAITCDKSPALAANVACGLMFLDGLGPASPGHPAVDPEPFYDACVNWACRNITEEQKLKERCNIFQGYIDNCRHKGLSWLKMPSECIECKDDSLEEPAQESAVIAVDAAWSNGKFTQKEWVQVPQGADAILVLEKHQCMTEHSQSILDLMRAVNRQLINEGLSDNRIGIVSFGGAGVHNAAHVQSIDGELFGGINRLSYIFNHMTFDGESHDNADVWGAISIAMDYQFRAGVAKHVFFMSCSECAEKSRAARSGRITRAMKEQNVTFSVLMNYDISLQVPGKKENDIFGYNSNSVFTGKLKGISDIEDFKGDTSLIEYINKPKNPCTKLAMATGGAVFSTEFIESKSFRNVFSLWVVKNSQVGYGALCSCIQNKNGVPQSICEAN